MNQEKMKQLQALLEEIPKGKVTTYKEIAIAMNTRAYRYIGQLLNKNPEPNKYPCYKVVNSNGELGGFAYGCDDKIKRLNKDGVEVKDGRVVNFGKIVYRFPNKVR